MLREEIKQLVIDIFSSFGERDKKIAESDPEACLVSLLLELKEDARNVSAMTKSTIEHTLYPSHLEKVKKLLNSTASLK